MSKNNEIGIKIKLLRDKNNMSQDRFGKKLGISGKTISAYETGRCKPSLEVIEKISQMYNASFLQLREDKRWDLENKINSVKDAISELQEIIKNSLSF